MKISFSLEQNNEEFHLAAFYTAPQQPRRHVVSTSLTKHLPSPVRGRQASTAPCTPHRSHCSGRCNCTTTYFPPKAFPKALMTESRCTKVSKSAHILPGTELPAFHSNCPQIHPLPHQTVLSRVHCGNLSTQHSAWHRVNLSKIC